MDHNKIWKPQLRYHQDILRCNNDITRFLRIFQDTWSLKIFPFRDSGILYTTPWEFNT